jgi:hypothetical protein
VYATHGAVSSDVHLPKDLSESVSAIGVYAGVSGACIEVGTWGEVICLTYHISIVPDTEPCFVPRLEYLSGALPPLRDAFCLWNHLLNAGARAPTLMLFFLFRDVESIDDFTGEDATLLCHLAPLAKAYGFKIYISRLTHTMSTKQEVQHPYKEYLESEDDIDRSDLYMSSKPKVEYEWDELRTLGGAPVRQPALLTCATKMVKTAGDLHDELMDLDLDEDDDDVEIEDDSVRHHNLYPQSARETDALFSFTPRR